MPPPSTTRDRRSLAKLLGGEAAGGVALLAAAAVAMVWASSPLGESYLRMQVLLHFWINDGAMTVFFFLVGLELRRELLDGELSSVRRAAFPAIAALGGMVTPAALFLALNRGLPSARGWGVPVATDIAFAVGVLALLGKRLPASARIFLLALAVIDDLGAVLIIALFYAASFSAAGVLLALVGVAVLLLLRRAGLRRAVAYVGPAILVWAGLYAGGIHPALAGVLLGLVTRQGPDLPPRRRLEDAVRPWVAFGVMPLFALVNAGVEVRGVSFAGATHRAAVAGVLVGLVLGKPVGIFGFSYVAARLGLAARPKDLTWGALLSVGAIAGIGFTMAIFIADLAFDDPALLRLTKLSILMASSLAAVLGGLLTIREKIAAARSADRSRCASGDAGGNDPP